MSRLADSRRTHAITVPTLPFWCAILALTLFCAGHLRAQTIATYSFEDGTADGWTSFNGASTPTATNAAAYSGSYSLLTTTSSTGAGGPSIDVGSVLLPGATYTITGYVELANGESASNANFTIKRTDPSCSGGTCYDTVGIYQVPVSSSGWVQIGGTYTVSTTETALTLYAQLVGATSAQSFYLDEVVITETAPPPGGTPIATYTFQDGGLDGWAPFGSATLTNTAPPIVDPNGDTHSLLTTNRTAGYMGPSLNLLSVSKIVAGATYQVSAYVLLAAPDSTNPTATISTKTTDCASTSGVYGNSANLRPAIEHSVDKSAGHVQLQRSSRTANQSGPLHPVQQRDRFLLHRRRDHQRNFSAAAHLPASRTTPASPARLKMAAWMDGVRARETLL